jgi:putative colanic acid biosynthesis acetyltransferase WcaF
MFTHDINDKDAYKHPIFSTKDKIKRLIWQITWAICCSWTPAPLHAWRVFILRCFGAEIGKSNFIYGSCKIWAPWLLKTEDVATIGPGVEIYNPGGVYLGHHAILSQDSYLCGATHDYNTLNFTFMSKPIVIKPYAWICAKAIVLPGVTCKAGSVLAAAAITSKNLEEWTVYGGNPAIRIKERAKLD